MNSYTFRYGDEVLKKYGKNCWYCGETLTRKSLSIDHFIPRKYNGSNDIENLRPCCRACNTTKGHRSLEIFREIMKHKKANLPKKITRQVVACLRQEMGINIKIPEHVFYFETI